MNVIVLGSGRIGNAMARDLAADGSAQVTVVDRDLDALEQLRAKAEVQTVTADLSDTDQVRNLVPAHDIVISAVPGFLGYQTLEAILHTGRNVIDIAFSPEDAFGLDDLAKEKGVTAVVDIGVSPGMSGVLVGHAASQLDTVDDVAVYVGGLPVEREWPWEYKAVFSPIDVIEEYVRPARLIADGRTVTRPALSEIELLDFDGVGQLEAFNTDGLRTLLHTIPARNMVEKTLRYPGHAERIRALRESGFFDTHQIDVSGRSVRPIDLTASLLFPMWQLEDGEPDLTVMRVEISGGNTRYRYDLLDFHDPDLGMTSMARTTGYTATTVARLVHAGGYDRKGISPPEFLGADAATTQYILEGLAGRGVTYNETIEQLD